MSLWVLSRTKSWNVHIMEMSYNWYCGFVFSLCGEGRGGEAKSKSKTWRHFQSAPAFYILGSFFCSFFHLWKGCKSGIWTVSLRESSAGCERIAAALCLQPFCSSQPLSLQGSTLAFSLFEEITRTSQFRFWSICSWKHVKSRGLSFSFNTKQ